MSLVLSENETKFLIGIMSFPVFDRMQLLASKADQGLCSPRELRELRTLEAEANANLASNKLLTSTPDVVDHPSHYTGGKIEVWDFIIDQNLSYCLGNVVKYVSRAGKKDPSKHIEDLKKAQAYLQREIGRLTDADS